MKYGYFDKQNNEYVIVRPDTPTPWINYIGNGSYGGIVSNTGGGYSFHKDPQNRRITRYRYNNLPADRPGRYIYIRDAATREYWNPGWQPVQKRLDSYNCRHGMGYTVLEGEYDGINVSVTYFVPEDQDFELWIVKVKNKVHIPRRLQVFSYAEFCFWDAVMDQQNLDWVQQINQGSYDNGIIEWAPCFNKTSCTFFASSCEVSSFDTNLEAFIGRSRSEVNPIAVENGACTNSISRRMNGVGAFCNDIELQANEEKEIVFILGYAENKQEIRQSIKDYLNPVEANEALTRLKTGWNGYVSKYEIDTPDEDINMFVNLWNQYQCRTTFNWSRFVSLYQTGLSRGMGIRDSAQDTLGVVHSIPEDTKELIKKLIKCQYTDGRVYHLFFPLTGEGGRGDAPVRKFDWYSDDHLWLIIAVCLYLKETGDIGILDEEVPYNDKTTLENVLVHLDKAIEFTAANTGIHKIALAGRADWNDTLNLDTGKGVAESVFTSMLYCKALEEMAELCDFLGRKNQAEKYTLYHCEMKNAINETCWDGEWYVRAFDDNSEPLGSKESTYGKIFINSQSWAVLGNVAGKERARKCMDSVEEHLNTDYGIVAMYPSYTEYDDSKGGITTYPPGAKENGGIFLHTNPWVIIAETMQGNGERAFKYYKQILPTRHNEDSDLYEVEPYVFAQNILGKEHPHFGTGRNSWLTGAAAWNFVAVSQYILGIRPGYDNLSVDPCIPSSWGCFKVKRVFRGAEYNIEVKNPFKVNKGITKMIVNGEEMGAIPVFEAGSRNEVIIMMGV